MPYATLQSMADRFGERELIDLTDRAEPYTGAVVEAVLARALEAADAEVDGYLRGRYAVPATPTPALLVDVACDLARWRLWDQTPPEVVKDRAKAAREVLRAIAAGTMVLDAAAAPQAADAGPAEVVFAGRPRFYPGEGW